MIWSKNLRMFITTNAFSVNATDGDDQATGADASLTLDLQIVANLLGLYSNPNLEVN